MQKRLHPPKNASSKRLRARQSFGWTIRDISRALTRTIQPRVERHGVPLGHWYILRALWERDGLTQTELSKVVGITDPSTVKAVQEMERRGLVRRTSDASDARKRQVLLTEKGVSLRDDMLPHVLAVRKIALKGLTASEVTQLEKLLGRVLMNLQSI